MDVAGAPLWARRRFGYTPFKGRRGKRLERPLSDHASTFAQRRLDNEYMPRILPDAVVFDMDGLIFDTESLYQKALLALALERGLHPLTQDVLDKTVGLSWEGTRILLNQVLPDVADIDELIEAWVERYSALALTDLEMKAGVRELLLTLAARDIPRAIATGSYRKVALRHLAAHDLDSLFEVVVAKEDCPRGKPAPDPFLMAAKQLGVKPERCWAIEDSLNGVRSASDAGMLTIMVPDLVTPDDGTRARCLMVVESLNDVVPLLKYF